MSTTGGSGSADPAGNAAAPASVGAQPSATVRAAPAPDRSAAAAPSIRPAAAADADAVAALLGELGYPTPVSAVPARLQRLAAITGAAVLVAELDGAVVGLATFHLQPVIHEEQPRGQLTALVVGREARGRGVGRALVRHVEGLAAGLGVRRLVVTTANHRLETHEFYARLGYDWTGRRYARPLGAAQQPVASDAGSAGRPQSSS